MPNNQETASVLKLINKQIDTSPPFESDVDPIQLLETLDEFITRLDKDPSDENITYINNQLKSWQIVTVEHNNDILWVTAPFELHKMTFKRPMSKRIAHLIKTGGEWQSEFVDRHIIEVETEATLPLRVPITSEIKDKIMDNKLHPLLVTLANIHHIIMRVLHKGGTTVGVFESPNAVISMNKLRAWIEENEQFTSWDIKYSLEVQNMDEIANQATFSVAPSTTQAI